MRYDSLATNAFFPLWRKYRPAILKLMVDSVNIEAQKYQFSKHEFEDLNPRKNTTYSFKLEVFEGAPLTPIKTSELAQDLLVLLKQSEKANSLMQTSTFLFELDKQFVMHISSVPMAQEEEETEEDESAPETDGAADDAEKAAE